MKIETIKTEKEIMEGLEKGRCDIFNEEIIALINAKNEEITNLTAKAKRMEEVCDQLYEEMSDTCEAEKRIARNLAITLFRDKAKESASRGWPKSLDEIAEELKISKPENN